MWNANVKNKITWTLALVVFAINALVSWQIPVAYAQFIDRIVHPCTGASARGTVQVTQTNVLINPCPGGVVTINGVPITPGAGLPDPGSNGFVVRTALNADLARTLTVSSPIVIANGSGVAGNPLFSCPTCVTSAVALTNFALMTGAALQGSKTPAVTATLLANGNLSTPGSVTTGNAGGVTGALDLSGLTSGTVTITVAAVAGTWTLRLPVDDGAANQFLQTDGAGVTSWQTIAAGVTPNATVGTVPYLSAATVYSDSPITRLSATHLQIFAGGVGGADFDSSAPSVSLNNGRYLDNGASIAVDSGAGTFNAGDVSGSFNGTVVLIDDANRKINLTAISAGSVTMHANLDGTNRAFTVNATGGNGTGFTLDDAAKTITLAADATTGIIDLNASAVKVDNLTASLPVYTDASKNLVSVISPVLTTYLGADFTNATATLNNTNLSSDVVAGNKYAFTLQLFVADSVAADGFQIDFNGGSATTSTFIAGSNTSLVTGVTTSLAGTFSNGTLTGTNLLTVSGSLEVSGTGTFVVRAAQSVHTAGTLTVSKGSTLVVTRR